jgi:hypothetical protein
LAKIATEERAHKGFKRPAFAVQVCVRKIDVLQIAHHRANLVGAQANIVFENLRVFLATLFVQGAHAGQQIGVGQFVVVMREDLKAIGFALAAWFSLVPYLAKNELVEFIKSLGWIELSAAPKGLVGLLETGGQLVLRHHGNGLQFLPLRGFTTAISIFVRCQFFDAELRDV